MYAISRTPDASLLALLAGATFADAFTISVDEPGLDAPMAAERAFASTPAWVARLLTLRNTLVKPFGLKGTGDVHRGTTEFIGFFPCVSSTPDRVVMGFDDTHLDFRVAVDVTMFAGCKQVTATTVVRPHNAFGKTYLALVMPFHKLIVPTLLNRVQQALPAIVTHKKKMF